jgi:3-isopropylmalate/(R)-2-methylmalate dehydratase large subunit
VGYTLAEKILANHTEDQKADAGEIIDAYVDFLMVHEVLGSRVIPILEKMGLDKVWDPDKILVVNDHWAPASDIQSAQIHARNREFVKQQGIKYFCDVNCGISHQVLAEMGLVHPGELVIGCDSHSTTYGAFNAFSTGLAATDTALILASGRCWFRVPESLKITVDGNLGFRIMSKDLILNIISQLGPDGANYQSMEFHGETIDSLSVGSRMTICNMTVEAGAKCGLMKINDHVKDWLAKRSPKAKWNKIEPDADAEYIDEIHINLDEEPLEPIVAKPHLPTNGVSVVDLEGIEIDQAFIGSCTNGRLEDIKIATEIVKGKKVNPETRLIVTPASQETYLAAIRAGYMEELMKAGAVVTNSTCGACIGGHLGVLGPDEICISSTNRNFRGRMGDKSSEIYLASPATVAASALYGKITDPRSVK